MFKGMVWSKPVKIEIKNKKIQTHSIRRMNKFLKRTKLMSNRMYFHLKLSFRTNVSYYRNVDPQFTGESSLGPFTHPIHTHDNTRCTSYVGQQFITVLPLDPRHRKPTLSWAQRTVTTLQPVHYAAVLTAHLHYMQWHYMEVDWSS